jgi:hypothetical protein
VKAALGIEDIRQSQQVALIGAAAVMEHEQPLRLAARRTFAV